MDSVVAHLSQLGVCEVLQYVVTLSAWRILVRVCKLFHRCIHSPVTWTGVHVDVSAFQVPFPLWDTLRSLWQKAAALRIRAQQLAAASICQLPMHLDWLPSQTFDLRWRCFFGDCCVLPDCRLNFRLRWPGHLRRQDGPS